MDANDLLRATEEAALRLHVCDENLDFSAASAVTAGYAWTESLDWSPPVETRTLYLSLPANNVATGAPTISGTALLGETLTADTSPIMDTDGLTGVDFTYQWLRVETDNTEADISGANSSTYTLAAADLGKTLKVRVSFDDDDGNPETLTSAVTVTVAVMAVCAVPSLSGRNVIWTGAMTVAADPTFAGVFGFESERFGSLDDQTFTVGANDYTTQQGTVKLTGIQVVSQFEFVRSNRACWFPRQ